MIIVSDTSPISALIKLKLTDLLPKIFGNVVIPSAVRNELTQLENQGFELANLWTADWLLIRSPEDQAMVQNLSLELDSGEIEAIVLAKEMNAKFLLIDEKKGRLVAQRLEIPILGLLGVILLGKRLGHIEQIRPIMIGLKKTGFRVSDSLVNSVLRQAGESPI